MKRPLAYITAAWCGSDHENTKLAAQYSSRRNLSRCCECFFCFFRKTADGLTGILCK